MEHVAQAVDPFVFRLSIFVLAVFVGYFVVWRIGDVRKMRENLLPAQIPPLIDDKTYSAVRNELALHKVVDLLGEERAGILDNITATCRTELEQVGIEGIRLGEDRVVATLHHARAAGAAEQALHDDGHTQSR